jgi:hypothetical protein
MPITLASAMSSFLHFLGRQAGMWPTPLLTSLAAY